MQALKKEIALSRALNHPNIVRYIYTDISPDKRGVDILLEYMPAGSLSNLLHKVGPLAEAVVRVFMTQILRGLQYLHAKGIIHRDLKCANVLVDNDGHVKLSDFGASTRLSHSDASDKKQGIEEQEPTELSKSLKGSPYWMAPEVVLRTGHNKAADIWSLGCVMIEMRTGKPPWSEVGHNAVQVLQAIASSTSGPPYPAEMFSARAVGFLSRCLSRNPEERPTAQDLLTDPFIVMLDSDRDAHAQQVVRQMSTELRTERVSASASPPKSPPSEFSARPTKPLVAQPPVRIQKIVEGPSPSLQPIVSAHEPQQLPVGDSKVISSKFARAMQDQQEQEEKRAHDAQRSKEAKRRLWEMELRQELEMQHKLKNNP